MKKEEFDQLEFLLGKLELHLCGRYCIIPHYLQDGPYIGLYDKDGNIKSGYTGPDIQTTVNKLIKK